MEIKEYYRDFCPPLEYAAHLTSIIERLPSRHLRDLGLVLLRDRSSLTRHERNRTLREGRRGDEAKGLYYKPQSHTPARIELFLDNILSEWPGWALKVPILRYEIVGRVFLHELGHHIYALENPRYPRNEAGASRLGSALLRRYFRRRYLLALPFLYAVKLLLDLIRLVERAWAARWRRAANGSSGS